MARRDPADDEPVRLGAVLDFMRILWAINHELESKSKRMDKSFGVTGPQRLALRIIGQMPGIGATRLAAILHIDPSTLTGVLRRLSDRGLVTRGGDPKDGRRVLLSLTPRGRAIDKLRKGTAEATVTRALRRFDAGKLEAAREVLEAMRAGLEDDRG